MEVHHSHHPNHKKKWTEYLLEFVMLFVAVSMGFLAENIREEQVVKHQTVSVLSQLHEELKLDTSELNQIALLHERFDTVTSFILYYINQKDIEKYKRDFYLLNGYNTYRAGLFESNCVALDQLKFAGLLKNVTDDSLRGLIEMYNYSLNSLASRTAREVAFMDKHIDELRLAPFDLYKTYYQNLEFTNNVKGSIVKEADVSCLNRTFHLSLITTFVPDNLMLKKFDKDNYKNILIELNIIRNSSQERQHSLAKKRAITLLKRLEEVYPQILNEKHI
jgi:hypothetical protein